MIQAMDKPWSYNCIIVHFFIFLVAPFENYDLMLGFVVQ